MSEAVTDENVGQSVSWADIVGGFGSALHPALPVDALTLVVAVVEPLAVVDLLAELAPPAAVVEDDDVVVEEPLVQAASSNGTDASHDVREKLEKVMMRGPPKRDRLR